MTVLPNNIEAGNVELSCVIPAYNAAAFIERAVNSVLCQSISEVEVIVVDDGSSDDTVALVRSITDPRIRVIANNNANRGPSCVRNAGLAIANGKYVTFLDADDWLLPQYAEKALTTAEQFHADIVFSGWKRVDMAGQTLGCLTAPTCDQTLYPDLCRRNLAAIQAVMVRRSLAVEVGGFDCDLRHHEDWDFWLRVCSVTKSIANVPETMSVVQLMSHSNSSNREGMDWSFCEVHRRTIDLADRICGRGGEFRTLYNSVNSSYWRAQLRSHNWSLIIRSLCHPMRRRLAISFVAHALAKRFAHR